LLQAPAEQPKEIPSVAPTENQAGQGEKGKERLINITPAISAKEKGRSVRPRKWAAKKENYAPTVPLAKKKGSASFSQPWHESPSCKSKVYGAGVVKGGGEWEGGGDHFLFFKKKENHFIQGGKGRTVSDGQKSAFMEGPSIHPIRSNFFEGGTHFTTQNKEKGSLQSDFPVENFKRASSLGREKKDPFIASWQMERGLLCAQRKTNQRGLVVTSEAFFKGKKLLLGG